MGNSHPLVEIICVECGQAAVRQMATGKTPLYCGNACKIAAYRKAKPALVARSRSSELKKKRLANAARVRVCVQMNRPKTVRPEPEPRHCPDCSAVLGKWEARCAPCREQHSRAMRRISPSRRANKAKRKALARGKGQGAECFDPIEIFNRDGWRCHICGVRTPKRLRGTYEDRAPELDHIVPLAAGGEHSRRNTACSCRKCNILKADKPLGQLRLVA